MLLEITRKRRHGLVILVAEEGRFPQIAVEPFLRRVPFTRPLKVRNARRTFVLVGSDGTQIVESVGNGRAELTKERSRLGPLLRGNRSRRFFRLLTLLRAWSYPVFRGTARGGS